MVDGKDLTVESVEQTNSDVIVNGGLEEDGVDLALGEDGNYYLSLMDDAKDYQSVGEATLPVDEDFVLTDNADQTNPNQTLLSGDLFSLQDDARGFTAENTTLTVEGGRLVSGQRVFVP